jgi:hypothetical protein
VVKKTAPAYGLPLLSTNTVKGAKAGQAAKEWTCLFGLQADRARPMTEQFPNTQAQICTEGGSLLLNRFGGPMGPTQKIGGKFGKGLAFLERLGYLSIHEYWSNPISDDLKLGDPSVILDNGKPVVRRGRKAMGS